MRKQRTEQFNMKRILLSITLAYLILMVLFYFLAGEQLHFRQSRGNFNQPAAETGTVELVRGALVEQVFTVKIQRLQSISVQWGTYYRPNTGIITMELWDKSSNTLLLVQQFDAGSVPEGGITTLAAETPIETAYNMPLVLRIYANSLPGSGISPLMSGSAQEEGFSLSLNGISVEGVLCFSALGEDYIWTGLHYWQFVSVFGLFLLMATIVVWRRYQNGRHSYVINAITAVTKYRFLIRQLVLRDFKAKYKRSVLGIFWSFLNPLFTMVVQYAVFSNLFRFDIPYYPVYLIAGIVLFNFFSESTNMALGSIVGNAGLITKVYMPKYIYPLTRVLSSMVNLLISLIPLLIVTLVSGIPFTKAYLLIPFVLVCLMLFSLGIGLLLAAAMVFFRDIQFLWGVFSMIWMYLTPIFYPASILPDHMTWVLKANPLYHFIAFIRTCVITGISPEPIVYVQCLLMSLGTLAAGALIFYKTQDRFVLHL